MCNTGLNEPDKPAQVDLTVAQAGKLQVPAILLIAGGVFVFIGQTALGGSPIVERWKVYLLTLFGMGLFFLSAYGFTRGELPRIFEALFAVVGRATGWTHLQIVLLGVSPALGYAAWLAAGDGPKMIAPLTAVGAWLLGIAACLLSGLERSTPSSTQNWSKQELAAVGALTLAAFLVRGTFTSQIPWVLSGDEASAGLSATQFIQGVRDNVFSVGWFSFPSMYFFIQSLSIRLAGQTIAALRLTSAIVGALTVAGLYAFARSAFGRGVALTSAAYLAAFHFHIHFSRIGLNNIWDGLFIVVFSWALWNAWRDNRRLVFILGGLILGLSQYFYTSSRSLFVMIPIWLVVAAFRDRKALVERVPNLIAMAITTLTVVLPLGLFFARHPDEFMAPIQRVTIMGRWLENEVQFKGVSTWSVLADQLTHSALGFTSENLRAWYQPGHPMLLALPSALFLLGLVLLLLRFLDLRFTWLAMWLFAAVIAGGLSQNPPSAQRYVFAAPVVALIVAFPIVEGGEWLLRAWPRRSLLPRAAMTAVLLLAISGDLAFYFADYSVNQRFGDNNTETATALGYYLADQEPGLQVFFFGPPRMGYTSLSTVPYLAPLAVGHDVIDPVAPPPELALSGPTEFIFLPERQAELDLVRQRYPDGNQVSVRGNHDVLLFVSYKVE